MANGNGRRKLDDWLTTYSDYTSEQESPSLFHFWVGASVIASALGRSVFMDKGYYNLFPNLYVVLVGASAQVRKTVAINIGYGVYRSAFTDAMLISQRGTTESMISLMVSKYGKEGVSEGVIVSDELEVFLGGQTRAVDLVQLLTKWYDCPAKFDYHTMMRGREEMNNVCCNLMAGTTPQGLKEGLPKHAIGGGFTSRVVFVYQEKPERKSALPEISREQKEMREMLVHDLRIISKLEGEFKLTPDGREWYVNWYERIFHPENIMHVSLDGYYGRKPDTLLKTAMILAISKSNKLKIGEIELRMALKALGKNEKYMGNIVKLVQMTEVGVELEKVVRNISKRDKIDFITLTRNLSYCMTAKRIEEILGELMSSDRIVNWTEGGKRWYRMK